MFDCTILGTMFLLLGACALCKSVFIKYDRTVQCYREFLRLLYSLRQKISSSALSVEQILESDDGYEVLVSSGFISTARKKGLSAGFSESEKMFCMDREDVDMLRKYFVGFGTDMLVAEIENLSMVIEQIEKKYDLIKDDIPSKKKIASTVIVCGALMLIILII